MAGQGFSDADNQAPLYFRGLDEMLKEFSYLGEDRAYEVVVKNTNMIADMCDVIRPVPRENYPHIDGCGKRHLAQHVLTQKGAATSMAIRCPSRCRRGLTVKCALSFNGYAVMYIIAQKLVTSSLRTAIWSARVVRSARRRGVHVGYHRGKFARPYLSVPGRQISSGTRNTRAVSTAR